MKKIFYLVLGLVLVLAVIGFFIFGQSKTNNYTINTNTIQVITYSLAEVASHNIENDCWSIIDNKVYDFTGSISEHPGGVEAISLACGKDGTSLFDTKGNKNKPHSPKAQDMLKSLYIGDLK